MDEAGSTHRRAELLATILLAIAALATAWSSYQSARWSGVQANDYSRANAARVESTSAFSRAGQETQVDVLTFAEWIDARQAGDRKLAAFYYKRFRPEFGRAVGAWLRSPHGAATPFAMPQYELAEEVRSRRLAAAADQAAAEAREANQRSDNYVLAVVLFAAALFFAGISTKLTSARQRMSVLTIGYAIFAGTTIWVLTFPVTVSI